MAASATGTPSTNFSFPKVNTTVDAPDGVGLNSIVDDIDSKLLSRFVQSASAKSANQVPIWNGANWTWGTIADANITAGSINNVSIGAAAAIAPTKLSAGSNAQFVGTLSGATGHQTGGMWMIQDTLLGGSAAAITFASIPQTFKHLILVADLRTDLAALVDWSGCRLNGISSATYTSEEIHGVAATSTASEELATTIPRFILCTGASGTGGGSGIGEALFANYTNTTFIKSWVSKWHTLGGTSTGQIYTGTTGGSSGSTAAITQIQIAPVAGANFVTGSRATLYGLG